MEPEVAAALVVATFGTMAGIGVGIVVATAAAAAAGSGLHRCGDIPLAPESPIPDWSYSHRSSRGRVPRVGATCHPVERTPAQASP